jgi:trimethylamine--corrinoid protein Co-methyltransferase
MTDLPRTVARPSRLRLSLLAAEDVERVYSAALEWLGDRGVVPASPEAREALVLAGARGASGAAGDDGALCVAAELVEAAAARAPKRVLLGGRAADDDVVLQPGGALLGAGGSPAPQAEPLDAGGPRDATGADLEKACRLADALPDVSVVAGPPLSAAPAGDEAAGAADIVGALRATTKHVQLTGLSSVSVAAAAASIATALRDDEASLRRRSPLSLLGDAGSFAAAAVLARRGLPVGVTVAATTTLPISRALDSGSAGAEPPDEPTPAAVSAAVVAFVADVLGANAALQALAPGAAFIAPVWPALAGLPAVGAAAATFIVAATQVLTRAGLPVSAAAFATSAAEPDWLACTDGSFAALSAAAAGAALVTGAGTLRGGAVFSPRQLVADAEIHSWCAAVAAGIPVDDETLAVDTIKAVGVGGNYLSQKHTRRHMKDVWRPRLLDRSPWDAWVADGRQDAADKAAELAGDLLARHEVEPLDAERVATLERIAASAGL